MPKFTIEGSRWLKEDTLNKCVMWGRTGVTCAEQSLRAPIMSVSEALLSWPKAEVNIYIYIY